MKAFEPKSEQPIFKLENTSGRKLVLSMQHLSYPGYEPIAYSIYAKAVGCDFFLFYPEDVDPINKKINARVYEDGQWIREMRDYPDVIDNGDGFVRSAIGKQMLVRIPHTCLPIFNKFSVSAWLEADPVLRKYAIPYVTVNDSREAVNCIDKMTAPVFFKPTFGSLGQGALRVARLEDGNYELTEDHDKKILTRQELEKQLSGTLKGSYIAQRYIKSCLPSGMPFDVRVHTRRDKTTNWHIVKIYARAGLAKALTSNLAGGGALADGRTFLRTYFGRTLGDQLYHQLEEIGKLISERVQRAFMAHTFDAIGIDFGIEPDGSIYLFELNDIPGGDFIHLENAVCSIDYAKVLALNPDLAFPEL